ncbi:MAG TPA: spore germination protein GerPC [Candidatus Udaeobacter sp.]|jgi:spore germination protein PC|nr:spore germination protein GerPC [Candidatus Udaeobacter sp.]
MQQPNQLSPWQMWSLEVQHKLNEQQEQLQALEAKVAALSEQVKKLEARPTYNIESIEYHFDQLKVEKLDGTLNIGMAAPSTDGESFPGSIDQLEVTSPQVFPSAGPSIPPPSETYNAVYGEMNRYLDDAAPQRLLAFEHDFGIPLDPYHRRIIIEDVRRQLPNRIHYYMKQPDNITADQQPAQIDETVAARVLTKTTRDAEAAMLAYMRQLQSGTPVSGGME